MKESFERIVAWARAHPWLAAAIVAGVILLAYLAYKKSGSGGSADIAPEVSDAPIEDTGAIGAGGIPDISSITTPDTSGGLVTTSSNGSDSYGLPLTDEPYPSYVSSAFEMPEFQDSLSVSNLGDIGGARKSAPAGTLAVRPEGAASAKKSALISSSDVKPVAPSLGSQANVKKSIAKAAPPANQTPTQALGKGRQYTGYINGVYYIAGYPALTVQPSAPGVFGSTKTISKG